MKYVVLSAALALALGGACAAADAPVTVLSSNASVLAKMAGPEKNAAIQSYTFDLDAKIVMHTFPWLRFHITGTGAYQRDGDILLHLRNMPWFAKKYQDVNIASILEPPLWAKQYTVADVQRDGGTLTIVMHDRKSSALTEARATVDQSTGVRELDWNYSYGGHVKLTVIPASAQGYELPSVMNVEAVMPEYSATAQANFTNYHVVVAKT